MKKLKILLYADAYNDRVGQSLAYVNFFSRFGEVMFVTAQSDLNFWVETADVLAIPGGADINPARYGEAPFYDLTRGNWNYEYLDTKLLPMWLETGKPIIGICRGLQTLNVALGGSLFQNVNGHQGGTDREEILHSVCTNLPKPFNRIEVNSFHHQAIKALAPEFDVVGWSPVYKNCPTLWGDGKDFLELRLFQEKNDKNQVTCRTIPEIIKGKNSPYIAFQYHPEEISCPLAIHLIEKTLKEYYNKFSTPKENPNEKITAPVA